MRSSRILPIPIAPSCASLPNYLTILFLFLPLCSLIFLSPSLPSLRLAQLPPCVLFLGFQFVLCFPSAVRFTLWWTAHEATSSHRSPFNAVGGSRDLREGRSDARGRKGRCSHVIFRRRCIGWVDPGAPSLGEAKYRRDGGGGLIQGGRQYGDMSPPDRRFEYAFFCWEPIAVAAHAR